MSSNSSGSGARKAPASSSSSRRPSSARSEDVTASRPAPARGGEARRPAAAPARGQQQRRTTAGGRPLVRPAPRSKVRRAHLTIAKIDLWSVAKLVFLLSVAVGIVVVVATIILWLVLEVTGIFTGINDVLSMLSSQGNSVNIQDYLSLGQVALYSTVLAVLNVVLLTLLGIIAGFLYNLAAKLVGGVGVTLTDD